MRFVNAVLHNLSAIIASLEGIDSPVAKGILIKLSKPKTVFMLVMFSQLLGITEGLHQSLQGEKLDLGKAVQYKRSVVDTLKDLCTETAAEEIYRRAMDVCQENNIQDHSKPRHKQRRCDEFVVDSTCSSVSTPTSSKHFRHELFSSMSGQNAQGAQ